MRIALMIVLGIPAALLGWCLGAVKDRYPEDSAGYERWEARQGAVIGFIERLEG